MLYMPQKYIEFLMDWAKENNFEAKMDSVRNTVIKVPPSPG